MQITSQQILELLSAYKRLDGERGKSYKFGAKVRMQLAQRIRRMTELSEDLQGTQKKLVAQYGLTGMTKKVGERLYPEDDPAKTRAYTLEWNSYLRATTDVTIGKFLLADLDLQTNSVSVQTLVHLAVGISDLPKQPQRTVALTLPQIISTSKAFLQLETEAREFKAGYQIKLNLAEIWAKLAAASDDMEIKRQAMVTERKLANYRLNADKLWESADDAEALRAFDVEWTAIKMKPISLEIPVVNSTDLDLDTNDIPGSVLSELIPVLADGVELAA